MPRSCKNKQYLWNEHNSLGGDLRSVLTFDDIMFERANQPGAFSLSSVHAVFSYTQYLPLNNLNKRKVSSCVSSLTTAGRCICALLNVHISLVPPPRSIVYPTAFLPFIFRNYSFHPSHYSTKRPIIV